MTAVAQRITGSKTFRGCVLAAIALAGVLAGLETSAALMERSGFWLRALDSLVLTVFLVEIVLKIASHGRRPLDYFRDGWNVFDFLIVALCLIPAAGPFAAVLRLARVLRLLRLVSVLPKLQLLVGALLKSLSAMGYVSLLLGLLFYIYAVARVHLFGAAVPSDFGSLPASLFTLFRIVTLDNWGDFFVRAIEHVHPLKVAICFVTFIVFGTMIILNLFIGIIMNSMSEMHEEIAAQDGADTQEQTGVRALEDELRDLEFQTEALRERMRSLRCRFGAGTVQAPG